MEKNKLRQKAEELLKERGINKTETYYQDIEKLVEELNIFQIELEMQNQELQETNEKLVVEQQRYKDLYMNAPVAYITLNKTGNIIELNKAAADLLQLPIQRFKFTSIFPYIAPESKKDFVKQFNVFFNSTEIEYGEIIFLNPEGEKVYTYLNATSYFDNEVNHRLCRCMLIDLTKTKQYKKTIDLQAQVIEKQKQYQELTDDLPALICEYLPDSTLTFVNKKYCEYFEKTCDELIGKQFLDFIPENEREDAQKSYLSLTKQRPEQIHSHRVSKNNEFLWQEWRDRAIFDKNNKAIKYRAIGWDITERMQAKEQILQLNNRLEASMFAGNLAWWEMELPSGKIKFNENKAKMLGYEPDRFKHYSDFMKLLHPDDYENAMQAMRDHMSGRKEVYEYEYRIQHKKGHYLWFYDVGKIIQKDKGSIVINGIVQNITDRKESVQRLKESEERFRTISEKANEGIILINNDGDVIYANGATEKIFEISINEIIGSNIHQTLGKDIFKAEHNKNFRHWQKTGEGKVISNKTIVEIKTSNNTTKFLELSVASVKQDNLWCAVGIINDITRLKKNEIHLKELNATKDKFFSIVAHDLKNPFNSILGFSKLLVKNIEKYDKDKIGKFVTTIYNSSTSAYRLLENLLEWSRAQTGRINFEPENLIVENLISDIIQLSQSPAQAKKITLEYHIDDSIIVNADSNMLNTILRNLISNAIKFTEKGGKIQINVSQNKEETIFSVSDNGIGMTPEMRTKLFKVDEKVSKPGTNNESGTGLGLLLCKEFIEKHGGKIWAESEPGKGSDFKFTIPR